MCFCVELDLQGNTLTKLPDAIGEMQHLISIDLSNNNFSVFPEQLTNVNTLQNINMSGNQISGIIILQVCSLLAMPFTFTQIPTSPQFMLTFESGTGKHVALATLNVLG